MRGFAVRIVSLACAPRLVAEMPACTRDTCGGSLCRGERCSPRSHDGSENLHQKADYTAVWHVCGCVHVVQGPTEVLHTCGRMSTCARAAFMGRKVDRLGSPATLTQMVIMRRLVHTSAQKAQLQLHASRPYPASIHRETIPRHANLQH